MFIIIRGIIVSMRLASSIASHISILAIVIIHVVVASIIDVGVGDTTASGITILHGFSRDW